MQELVPHSRVAPGRSCIACRRRKIRCDRHHPCAYCTKFGLSCSYPEPGPIPESRGKDTKRLPESDVLSRLDRIEKLLQRLQVTGPDSSSTSLPASSRSSPRETGKEASHPASDLEHEAGKLLLEEGDTRYATSTFWTELHQEEEEEEGEDDGLELNTFTATPDSAAPRSTEEPQHQGFLFSLNSVATNLRQLHPDQPGIFTLWQIYLENVDPVLKILHVPSTQRQLMRACQDPDNVPPAFECLMFAIYFAAVTSTQNQATCQNLLQEPRQTLLGRFRLASEQALAKARFLNAPGVPALQALTLFLICARQSADKAFVWSMTGLLVRLAKKLGLHRDPAGLGLPPFKCEMRRRLWWQICILDVRVAEDNDMDPCIYEHDFDTKYPANVNDCDLDVNMTQPAAETGQRSEMLFSLCRFEVSYAARKLVFSPKFVADNGYPTLSLEEKCSAIEAVYQGLDGKYLKHCDGSIPICYVASSATRMILAKIKLTVHHPARNDAPGISHERLVELVGSSIEILEYAQSLRSNEAYSRWLWLFQTYIEWDAAAFLLHTLGAVPFPMQLEREWKAANTFFEDWESRVVDGDRRWRRLQGLRSRAVARQSSQASCSADSSGTLPATAACTQSHGGIVDPSMALSLQAVSLPNLEFACLKGGGESLGATALDARNNAGVVEAATSQYQDWNFDNSMYVQEAPDWAMKLDEYAFKSW